MSSAVAPSGGTALAPPLSYLPKALRAPRQPLRALGLAWLVAFVPSIVLGAAVSAFLPDLGQPNLPVVDWRALGAVVVLAPLVETLIMGAALSLLLLIFPPTVAILLSAIGWGIAHSLVAPAWGLVIWWPFLIFSTLYVVWRQRSLLAALAMPAAAHALHNSLPAISLLVMNRS